MSSQILLSGGDKWYSYSGVLVGDVSVPATISMILISNTGLKDSYVKLQPYYAKPVSTAVDTQLGLIISLDDTEIYKSQAKDGASRRVDRNDSIDLFIPRQSKLEIISMNTSGNNTQERGVNLIGYYL